MTSGTRRNGFSESPLFRPAASPRYDGPESQAQDDRGVFEFGGYEEHDYAPYEDTSAYGDAGFYGYQEPAAQADHDAAAEAGSEGHETEPDRNTGRRTGRHASARPKTTRKRVGRVVPAAAVAATLAAGAAAYALGSTGHPQASNLNAAMSVQSTVASAPSSRSGTANVASSAPIKVATATASAAARPSAKHAAKATPSGTPTPAPSAATSSAATSSAAARPASSASDEKQASARATQAATRTATQTATQAAVPAANLSATSRSAAPATVSCNLGSGLLPANVTAIVSFLLANGYSHNAAAGIAGNMYQESKGDPESVGSGGGGLIGWTPLPSGFVTGNVTADLRTQLAAVLTYNQGWSSYLPALNSAASPADAADIYVTDFERAGIPAAATRETSAQDVASACGI